MHSPPSVENEQPRKKLRMENEGAQRWSWPYRVDEIAGSGLGDCLAITDDTRQITWSELSRASKVVAKSLKKLGLTGTPRSAYRRNGEAAEAPAPMVTMLPHNLESVIILLGVLRQGFPLLPLSITHNNRSQLLSRYEDAMLLFEPVAAVVTDTPTGQNLMMELKNFRPVLQVISASDLLNGETSVEDYEDVVTTTDHVLSYIFTSGSTGKSKCVVATNRMAWAECQWYPELFQKLGYQVDPRKDRWRLDHEMGWWGAAFFGEVDVALAMAMCIVMMKPTDPDWGHRGVTVSGALPSQLNNLWPAAKNIPSSLRVVFSWAERCDVELGRAWLAQGVKMADLLIATEYFLTFASCNLELAKGSDGRVSHAMRPLGKAQVFILDESLKPLPDSPEEFTGLLGVAGPQVTPGYVERLDGRALIGAGPLSEDMFKVINGEWVLVPKDIIKKRPDNSIVSIGRGGGTVKVRGGVLMATNVAELRLTRGAVSACCITEPVHVEGGASVVLELQRGDRWGLRKSLQDASFLRMPILYTCTMPRNESTGKVQKALVQELRKKEAQLEAQLRSEQRGREQSQVAWYWRMIKPVLLLILGLQPRSAWNLVQALLSSSKLWWILLALLGVGKESVLQLCLAAWTYGALAQAGACGQRSFVVLLPLLPALLRSLPGALVATALLTAVLLLGQETKKWQDLRQKVGRLRFSIALALLLRLPSKDASCLYSVGLLLLYAGNRRPPFGPGAVHQVSAYLCSLVESLRYMACFPVLFLLALPSMVQSELQKFAWSKLSANLSGFAKQAPAEVEPLLKRVSGRIYWKRIWVDFEAAQDAVDEDDPMGADLAPAVPCVASSPAQICAQQLARQAGVDFRSVDSLKIARLSVLLKKYMKPKGGLEALEFNDLREAAADEGSFLRLAEERLEVAQPEDAGANNSAGENRGTDRLMEFLTGGLRTHREGATNAPWDCQVDVLLRWQGAPLNEERLQRAVDLVIQQQPMLRACVPPDDSTDLLLGSRNSGFSTTVAASWSLLNELNFLEQWPKVRRAVAGAIYLCWPRTFIRSANAFKIPKLAKTTSKDSKNLADEVYGVMNESGWAWWRSDSSLNMCLIHLEKNSEVTSCVYCSVTHKYADGGAVAAFVTALSEAYAVLERGEMPSGEEHPVLSVQEQRLWRYLEGLPGREGQVDVYLFDIVNDMYNHKWGHSVGIDFTMKICDLVRAAGRRMACSEEIAWISCMSCAMLRLMPDEEMLKLMIVHNGRLGEAEGAVACVSNYVMLRIPCLERGNSPVADICSRVKYMVTHGHFSRPRSTEQAHARLNIGGMIGTDGNFVQLFKTGRGRDPSWSRAPYVIQLRMDNEGGIWCVKDFKCHEFLDPTTFWRAAVAAAQEIAEGNFTTPVAPVAPVAAA